MVRTNGWDGVKSIIKYIRQTHTNTSEKDIFKTKHTYTEFEKKSNENTEFEIMIKNTEIWIAYIRRIP